jgi:hypothetical protein
MLIPVPPAWDESFYITRTRQNAGNGAECAHHSSELRLRERLVKFLRCKFNKIGRPLEDRWKL